MRTLRTSRSTAIVCGAALILAAAACNSPERDGRYGAADGSGGAATADRGKTEDRGRMTLVGCLQRGDGDDFILTQVNEQPRPVATSGERESSAVQQKQQEAASQAYKLSGGPDNLRDMVGHQVRVTGTVSDRSEVQERDQEREVKERDRQREVKERDLATLEVASAESVANACGNAAAGKGTGER